MKKKDTDKIAAKLMDKEFCPRCNMEMKSMGSEEMYCCYACGAVIALTKEAKEFLANHTINNES